MGTANSSEDSKCTTASNGSGCKESPRTQSGRRIVKSKRLISTESAEDPSIHKSISTEVAKPDNAKCSDAELSTEAEAVPSANLKTGVSKATFSTSSKSKPQSESESCYNPETQTSDSATANSDVEFPQPLRKSSRVRGPKPPQIRDPIENPAPKTKRRLSERKFEGAKPFKCNHCPLSYSNIESKKTHEQTHEEKPFQCVYCDMRFTAEINLKKHTRIHKP